MQVEQPVSVLYLDSFPCFRRASGVCPWDPHPLAAWAEVGAGQGKLVTIQFLLAVQPYIPAWS